MTEAKLNQYEKNPEKFYFSYELEQYNESLSRLLIDSSLSIDEKFEYRIQVDASSQERQVWLQEVGTQTLPVAGHAVLHYSYLVSFDGKFPS